MSKGHATAKPQPHGKARRVPLHDLPPCDVFVAYALRLYVRSAVQAQAIS